VSSRAPRGASFSLNARPTPLTLLGIWAVIALAAQRWTSWDEAIRDRFASDMSSYETIARAAPSLPEQHVLRPYAERFPVHWLVGSLADATGIELHSLYRVAELALVALALIVVNQTLSRLRIEPSGHLLALGVLAASAYPVHYLLAASGMVSDAVFVLGLSVCLLGFVDGRFALVLAGLTLSVLGRQTGVPVAFAAALWVAHAPAWRHARWRRTALVALLPLGTWLALHFGADRFAMAQRGGLHDLSVLGYLTGPRAFLSHLGRTALPILVPCALAGGAWLRTRGDVPRGPLLLAAAVVVQPLLLGPSSAGENEPRLAALCLPALAVAAGALLRGARLRGWETAVIGVAVFAAGLHHRYTHVGLNRPAWLALEIAGSAVILAVLARPVVADFTAARRSARRFESG